MPIKWEKNRIQLGITGVFFILLVTFILANPSAFLKAPIYRAIMTTLPILVVLSVSLVLVVASREIDLSFGSIMGLSAWAFTLLLISGRPVLGFFLGLLVGCAAGALNGILIRKLKISSLVTTLGMMFFWRGVIMVGTDGRGKSLAAYKGIALWDVLAGRIGGFPVQMLWAVGIAFGYWVILNRHRVGAHIYYSGDNEESTRMMGINVDRTKVLAFALVGLASGFAGMLSCMINVSFWPTTGDGYLLAGLAAVFVGGTPVWGGVGTVYGSFVGACLIRVIESGLVAIGLTGFWTQLVFGLVIVLSIAIHQYLRK